MSKSASSLDRAVRQPGPWTIDARVPGARERLRDAWRHRRLATYFGRRFNQKRYVRTGLGRTWLFLRPGMLVASQAFVFGAILRVPSGSVPYLVLFVIGLSSWHLFAETAYWATRSLELNRRALSRIHLPRLNILVAAATPAIIDFLIFTGILALVLAYFGIADGAFHLSIGAATPAAIAGLTLLLLFGLGIGLWLAVPGAMARDVRFTLRFVLTFWYLMTPVIYPLSAVPDKYRAVIELNPLTAPIQLVKLGLVGQDERVPLLALGVSLASVTVLLLSGAWIFLRSETAALDRI